MPYDKGDVRGLTPFSCHARQPCTLSGHIQRSRYASMSTTAPLPCQAAMRKQRGYTSNACAAAPLSVLRLRRSTTECVS
jgi:hypothetical protein